MACWQVGWALYVVRAGVARRHGRDTGGGGHVDDTGLLPRRGWKRTACARTVRARPSAARHRTAEWHTTLPPCPGTGPCGAGGWAARWPAGPDLLDGRQRRVPRAPAHLAAAASAPPAARRWLLPASQPSSRRRPPAILRLPPRERSPAPRTASVRAALAPSPGVTDPGAGPPSACVRVAPCVPHARTRLARLRRLCPPGLRDHRFPVANPNRRMHWPCCYQQLARLTCAHFGSDDTSSGMRGRRQWPVMRQL